jgi:hypothetical protein
MNVVANDRTVIRYEYGRTCCCKMFAGIKNVHIFSMDNTPSYIYFFSVAAVVSLYSTCVTFSYQYQNDIGNEIVLRTTAEVTYEHF